MDLRPPRLYKWYKPIDEREKALDMPDLTEEQRAAMDLARPPAPSLPGAEGEPDATEMLKTLTADHRIVAERANKVLKLAAGHEDEGTAAIASERIEIHEKAAWMLSAHLGD